MARRQHQHQQQPLKIIRPNHKNKVVKENEKSSDKAANDNTETNVEKTVKSEGGDEKENSWSEWTWNDDGEGAYYYRARREGEVWKYEYTPSVVPSLTQSTPISNQNATKEESPGYFEKSFQYPKDDEKYVYVTEKKVYRVPNGEGNEEVFGSVEEFIVPTGSASGGEPPKSPGNESSSQTQSETKAEKPVAGPSAKPESPTKAPKSVAPEKMGKGRLKGKDRIEKVDDWLSSVDTDKDSAEKGEKHKEKPKEKHSKKKEERHRDRRR